MGRGGAPVALRPALWLLPYLGGLLLLSWLGQFGDGLKLIGFGWDALLGALLATGCLLLAVHLRLDDAQAARHRAQEAADPAVED